MEAREGITARIPEITKPLLFDTPFLSNRINKQLFREMVALGELVQARQTCRHGV